MADAGETGSGQLGNDGGFGNNGLGSDAGEAEASGNNSPSGHSYGGDGGGHHNNYWSQQQAEQDRLSAQAGLINLHNMWRQGFARALNSRIGDRNRVVRDRISQWENLSDNWNDWSINDVQDVDINWDGWRSRFNNLADDRRGDFNVRRGLTPFQRAMMATQAGSYATLGDVTNKIKDADGNMINSVTVNGKTHNLLQRGDLNLRDMSGVNGYLDQVDARQDIYNDLMGQRQSALDADSDFRNDMNTRIANFNEDFGVADIWEDGTLGQYRDTYRGIRDDFNDYESLLNGVTFGGISENIYGIKSNLDEQQGIYDAEVQRVEDFTDALGDTSLRLGNEISDLTIADIDAMDQYRTDIDDQMNQILDFESQLDPSLVQYMEQFGNLDTSLDNLYDARTAEQGRIETDRNNFQRLLRSLNRDIGRAEIYDGNALENLEDRLYSVEDDILGYDSLLNPTFDTSLENIATGFGGIDDIMGQRQTRLGELNDQVAEILSGAQGAELYEEDAFNTALDDLAMQQMQLDRFSGAGLGDNEFDLMNANRQVNDRLSDLADYRTDLESQAQDMLDSRGDAGNRFMDQAELDAFQAQFDPLSEEVDLYNAFEANNEMNDLLAMLEEGQANINTDVASVQAREDMEARQALADLFGGSIDRDYIVNQLASGNIRGDEYASLMRKLEEQDPDFASQVRSQYDALYA